MHAQDSGTAARPEARARTGRSRQHAAPLLTIVGNLLLAHLIVSILAEVNRHQLLMLAVWWFGAPRLASNLGGYVA